jgi:ubiquitin-protein ligase
MPKLPTDILRKRVQYELGMCQRKLPHEISVADPDMAQFPVVVRIKLLRTPGPIMKAGKVGHLFNHKLKMFITDEYPYEKPLVHWLTPIFHPNIMEPNLEGHVCTKLLDDWNFNSTLLNFIQGLESLLLNPNPNSPWASESCQQAAKYFAEHDYTPPTIIKTQEKGPKIIGKEEEKALKIQKK